MTIDVVFVKGFWWLDTVQAARMLCIAPESLRRNRSTCKDLRGIECMVWHRSWLWRLDDVARVSQARLIAQCDQGDVDGSRMIQSVLFA